MKKTKSTSSFKENIQNMLRAYRMLYELDRKFLFMQILNGINMQLRVYVNAWIAALVIDGVMANKPVQTLLVYAVIAVTLNLVMNMIAQITAARRYVRKSMWPKMLIDLFHKKSEKMDYPNFEDKKVREKWDRIHRQIGWRGVGRAYLSVINLFIQLSGIVFSIPLIFRFFLSRPQTASGNTVTFLTSPWILPLFLVLNAIYTAFLLKLWNYTKNTNNRWNDFYGKGQGRHKKITVYKMYNDAVIIRKIYGLDDTVLAEDMNFFKAQAALDRDIYRKNTLKFKTWNAILDCVMVGFFYFLVALKVTTDAIPLGSVLLYTVAFAKYQESVAGFITEITAKQSAEAAMYRDQYSYLDMEQKMYHGTLSVEKRSDRNYQVEFRDVSFRYPGAADYALRHVNFKFHVGQRLAVVGMNGSGKTTFIKLMCRLYDPTEGTILLNGIDIKKYDYDEYMAIFSVVFQDFKLFAYPLAENVAATKDYNVEKVQECLRDVGLDTRVSEMKNGIETCLYRGYDPEGVEISGGEAQKIALARALYKNAPFIILDEPTASLDPLAEADIYSHFNDIVGDKTAIYISHRLSSCRFCDIIAVFHEGEIIEVGTHDELVADTSSKYYELWNAQAQYYTETDKQTA